MPRHCRDADADDARQHRFSRGAPRRRCRPFHDFDADAASCPPPAAAGGGGDVSPDVCAMLWRRSELMRCRARARSLMLRANMRMPIFTSRRDTPAMAAMPPRHARRSPFPRRHAPLRSARATPLIRAGAASATRCRARHDDVYTRAAAAPAPRMPPISPRILQTMPAVDAFTRAHDAMRTSADAAQRVLRRCGAPRRGSAAASALMLLFRHARSPRSYCCRHAPRRAA